MRPATQSKSDVSDSAEVAPPSGVQQLVTGRAQSLQQATSRPGLSDEQIVAAVLAGADWAAEELYHRVHTVVERTLRRVLQTADGDYTDLVQVAFERVVRSLVDRRFSGACSLTTWASAIAANVGVDALRARMRERSMVVNERSSSPELYKSMTLASLEAQLEARSEIEQLEQILSTMKPEQAETVFLHDGLGHELAEVARLMGVSVAAAQSRLVRGRKELFRRARLRLSRG
jgi:RNA polymerase sigma-70 factor (ECF subfamily)